MAHPMAGKKGLQVINPYYFQQEFHAPPLPLAGVKFGTSGHRGRLGSGFSERHAEAIAQAVARMHEERGIKGPILVGGDTRLVSRATSVICAEVLAANGFSVILADGPLPTPVFSSEILAGTAVASLNGTASHNPPQDMGLKYNPSHGGPAETEVTGLIEAYAKECLADPGRIRRIPLKTAESQGLVLHRDLIRPYLERLSRIVDLVCIKESGLRIGIHPLGGASIRYYETLREEFGLENLEIVDTTLDPTFGFIPLDHDGQIRMDPSSVYPMRPLLDLLEKGKYDFVGASDPDADRFGVATREAGLLSPNHALSIVFHYLLNHRPAWPESLGVGRTIGTTHLVDRIAAAHGRPVDEVNVGFKYYVQGLREDRYALAGEESAGLSVYRWVTEKDGILAVLLLAEVMARSGKDLSSIYKELISRYGEPFYRRIDVPADEKTRSKIKSMKASDISGIQSLVGEEIVRIRDTDGIKIYTENAWVLARPSGTEPIAKLYAETFRGPDHLRQILIEGGELFGLETRSLV
ncbi:MAG: alpha-D-glucose phosphate-specific phosphoglucomutase [Armatimonadetes bacterium]|nr:alpha-D-glucose phosphate-specific phosphoglucomutase [Armatimonadota bacterium]